VLWGSPESDATESDQETHEDFFCAITWLVCKLNSNMMWTCLRFMQEKREREQNQTEELPKSKV